MCRILSSIFLCFVIAAFGQTSPEIVKQELDACKTDSCLIASLLKRNMIGKEDYYWTDGTDTNKLSIRDFKINIVYKNLFGDTTREAVFEMAYLKQLYYLNFFFKEKTGWKKVPNYIYHLHNSSMNVASTKETLSYSFEELIKANEYALVMTKRWSFDNNMGTNMDIVAINKRGFSLLHEESIILRAIQDDRLIKDRNTLYYFENGKGKNQFPKNITFLTTQTDCNEVSNSIVTTKTTKKIELSHIK